MWCVGCSTLNQPLHILRELYLGRALVSSGWTMYSVMEQRVLCWSALTMVFSTITADILRMLVLSAQVSFVILLDVHFSKFMEKSSIKFL